MKRREYLRTASIVAVAGIAGCLDDIDATTDGAGTRGKREFGEVVEHRGVEVVPTHWLSTDEIGFTSSDTNHTVNETPSDGAEFVIVRIKATNVGDNPRVLPSRSSAFGGTTGRDIDIYYNGEQTTTVRFEDTSSSLHIDGESLTPYEQSRRENDAQDSVYPETEVIGWVVSEITAKFDPENTTIEIEWGASSLTERDYMESTEWTFEEEVRIDAEEATEIDEKEGTAIEL